jgi:outer membrane immunogenic protein
MRNVLGAVGGVLGVLAGPAIAAEMANPGDPPVAPAFTTWTGFYAGGNIGYGWTNRTGQVSFGSPAAANPIGFAGGNNGVFQTANGTPNGFPQFFTVAWNSPVDGVIGGGQLGANWQVGSIVLGVEADAEGSSQRKTITAPMPVLGSLVQDYNQPWFATFRGRVGWAFVDGWLAYATGGGAWLDSSRAFTTPGWAYAPSSFELSHHCCPVDRKVRCGKG